MSLPLGWDLAVVSFLFWIVIPRNCVVYIDLLGQKHSFLLPVVEVSLSLDGVDGVDGLDVLVYVRVSSHWFFFLKKKKRNCLLILAPLMETNGSVISGKIPDITNGGCSVKKKKK